MGTAGGRSLSDKLGESTSLRRTSRGALPGGRRWQASRCQLPSPSSRGKHHITRRPAGLPSLLRIQKAPPAQRRLPNAPVGEVEKKLCSCVRSEREDRFSSRKPGCERDLRRLPASDCTLDAKSDLPISVQGGEKGFELKIE